jgi:alpha-mannosidase
VTLETGSDGWVVVDGALRFRLLDEPDVGDLYNFCHAVEGQRADPPSALETDGNEVRARWDGLVVGVRVRRRVGERTYELDGAIDNERPDHRLRLAVGLDEETTGSIAGSPFELVRRPTRSEGGDVESDSPTWPARHVVLAGAVAAFHEGVFEYEATGRELLLTLLRCVGTISRQRLATRPWAAGPDVPTPDAQMLGTTTFRIGLRPGATVEDLLFDWGRFALPLRESAASGGGHLPSAGALLDVSGTAVLSNVRRRDGAVEARMWNPSADLGIDAIVAGRPIHLGPARIETVRASRA